MKKSPVQVKIKPKLHREVKSKAAAEGLNLTELTTALFEAYNDGNDTPIRDIVRELAEQKRQEQQEQS